MPRTRTLAELRNDVATEADIAPLTGSSFVTSAHVDRYINQSIRALVDLVLTAGGEQPYESSTTISTVAGQAQYALPADFYRLTLASVTIDGISRPMPKADLGWLERTQSTGYPLLLSEQAVGYRIVGNSIELAPAPDGVYPVALRYVPTLVCRNAGGTPIADLSADDDYFDGRNGWEDYIVYDSAVRVAIREERDPGPYAAFRSEAERRIVEGAEETTPDPDRVRVVF